MNHLSRAERSIQVPTRLLATCRYRTVGPADARQPRPTVIKNGIESQLLGRGDLSRRAWQIFGASSRKSGSHETLRWRKEDSNSWSHF
jgi:hypothetical protein